MVVHLVFRFTFTGFGSNDACTARVLIWIYEKNLLLLEKSGWGKTTTTTVLHKLHFPWLSDKVSRLQSCQSERRQVSLCCRL